MHLADYMGILLLMNKPRMYNIVHLADYMGTVLLFKIKLPRRLSLRNRPSFNEERYVIITLSFILMEHIHR